MNRDMLREMEIKDYELTSELIGKINRSAGQIFTEANNNNEIKKGLIFRFLNNKGVFTIIEKEDFIVSHIAFEEDIQDNETLNEIHKGLKEVIEEKSEKDLYLNIYGKNPSIISYFRQYGFKKDSSGIQYKYKIKEENLKKHESESKLEFRRYESELDDTYIELLDEAFRPLHIACNIELYPWKRDKESG